LRLSRGPSKVCSPAIASDENIPARRNKRNSRKNNRDGFLLAGGCDIRNWFDSTKLAGISPKAPCLIQISKAKRREHEGWNPGKSDMGIAWDTDPEAFIALHKGSDHLAGGGTIIRYGDDYGFMGLFIVRRDLRGDGLGGLLWRYRLKRLQDRLAPGATIGMDGVSAIVPFYEHGGFNLFITMCVTKALRAGRLIRRFHCSVRQTSILSIALMVRTYPRQGLHFFAVGFFS
jgi:hypothetical protein